MIRSRIVGTGSYLPERVLTNADLEKMVETTDEWIVQRTGIRERHIASDSEPTSLMATRAAQRALEVAGLEPSEIDGIIVGTTSPDKTFPSVAVMVQSALGMGPGPCFDVQAVCSGFIYALGVADSLIRTGVARRFLVIGAERFSNLLDWSDRATCVLFGDGAGAVVLEAAPESAGTLADRGVLSTHLYADGRHQGILCATGGPGTTKQSGVTHMQGKDVFKYAVGYMANIVEEVLATHRIDSSAIDWLVPHQANLRIISATADKLHMGMDRVVVTVGQHGNTSAASIPLALDVAVRDGRIQPGHLVLLEGLGAGLTWGAALVRF